MQNRTISIGTASANQGEIAYGVFRVASIYDASTVNIPVIVVNGAKSGKCVWIQNGVHGNEYVGARTIHNLLAAIEPEDLSGSIVLIPMANILAFRSTTRSAEQDGLDMNRVWPGNDLANARSLSAHTEIVVHHLYQAMSEYADIVIDCHSGGWANKMANWVAYLDRNDEASKICERLAIAAGFDVIWRRKRDDFIKKVQGSLSDLLAEQGIPCLVIEAGGEGRVDHGPLQAMTRAMRNILFETGVCDGKPEIPYPARYVVRGNWLRAKEGGMFRQKATLLQEVIQGDAIGMITDLHGDRVEDVLAPADGIVIGIRTLAVVNSGEYVGNVAEFE